MRCLIPLLLFVCVLLAHVEQVHGAEASSQAALSLGHEALQHFARGEFAAAREKFERADRLAHSPVFVLYQARAERKLGNLLRARKLLEECAGEPITASSPDAWRKAVADSVLERDQVAEIIPRVRFVLSGEANLPISINGNGRKFELSEPETSIAFDPGTLHVVAEDAAGTRLMLDIHLAPGKAPHVLELRFPRVLRAPPPGQELGTSASLLPRTQGPSRPYRSGAHAAFFLGGSALLFSAVATSVAVVKAGQVKKGCVDDRCRPEDQAQAQSALRWANLATAGFVVGATGVLSGIGLLVVPTQGGGEVAVSGHF